MRRITSVEANEHLAPIGLHVGQWGQLTERERQRREWIHRAAPTEALALYCFSHRILQWLPRRAWVLVQVNDSTNFKRDEDFLVARLLFGVDTHGGVLIESRSFLFELGVSHDRLHERWLLGDLLHVLLLFGHHCDVVSDESTEGQRLSVQDGYAYFVSQNSEDISRAAELLKEIDAAPLTGPPDLDGE